MVMRLYGKGVGGAVVSVIAKVSATNGMRFCAPHRMLFWVSCAGTLDPLLVSMSSFLGTNV